MPDLTFARALTFLEILAAPAILLFGAWRWGWTAPAFKLFLASCLAVWVLHNGAALVLDRQLERYAHSFDTDGDGIFSPTELTPEAQKAIDRWTSDTARTFAPFAGVILAVVANTIVFGGFAVARGDF